MQRRPAIARAFIQLNMAVMQNQGRVTSDLKRLIGYMASLTAGCRYCQAHTIRAAERYGAAEEKLQQIWEYASHPAFTNAERVVLDLAVAASVIPNSVDEVLAQQVRLFWDEGEIVEIMGVIALFGYLNRWNDSMATQIESPAQASGEAILGNRWEVGKHG